MKTFYALWMMLFFAAPLYADKGYYDQQEEIRRAAEKLVEHDRQQRQEAKERYEKKNTRRSTSWEQTWELIKMLFWLGLIVFLAYCMM